MAHNARGNLTADGGRTYARDIDNPYNSTKRSLLHTRAPVNGGATGLKG
jgi:hypothetical protein